MYLYYQLLNNKVAVPLYFQLCSPIAVLQTDNSMGSASVITSATTEITDDSHGRQY